MTAHESLLRAFTQEVKIRFEIVQGEVQLSSHSGLALVGAILDRPIFESV